MECKVTGFVWNIDGDEFVNMTYLSEQERKELESVLQKHETDDESFPLIRESDPSFVRGLDNYSFRSLYEAVLEERRRRVEELNKRLNHLINEAKATGFCTDNIYFDSEYFEFR